MFSRLSRRLWALTCGVGLFIGAGNAYATTLTNFDAVNGGLLTGEDLFVSAIGSGACSGFSSAASSASGNALCGEQINSPPSEIETLRFYNVNFDELSFIEFAFAAFTTGGATFERSGNEQAYLRVIARVGTTNTLLDRFSGAGSVLASSIQGATTNADGSFSDFIIGADRLSSVTGIGELRFVFLTTSAGEHLGLDNVVSSVPLPASLAFGFSGLVALGLVRRRRKI